MDTAVPPARQIRANFDDTTVTVYQAYSAAIAVPAAASGTFAATPFKLERMTWIKPSFLWMMYRSGWASKPDQERVLAIRITRPGFEEALSLACLSHFDAEIYPDHATWAARKEVSPVRVQWDPERDLTLEPLPWRSLQVGLSGPAAREYTSSWLVHIDDVTERVQEIHRLIAVGQHDVARSKLPAESPYPLPAAIAATIGASQAQ
ncbi:DUF4291 domain-containing protein [Kribbella deserti]|uniref:DUF4291 domain-containing protein n=1 Tax=Kribbella deserti TaxID=1926257 RepID=A0ABV6QNW7_9ACTN